MKKILFLAAILLANISCQEEDSNMQVDPAQSPKLKVVQITQQGDIIPLSNETATRSSVEGELALQFNSESDYQSAIAEIGNMNTHDRLAYVGDFISLQKLAVEADKELDAIGEEAVSEADFRNSYAQYVEKYNGKLIINEYDEEDLTLYVPDADNLATYLVNENKKVVIGNEIREISLDNDMSYSEKAVFAATEAIAPMATKPNKYSFKETVGSKKTAGSVEIMASSAIEAHVGCQKKMWYGWKRDNNRDVYYQLDASNMYYTYLGPYASTGQPPIRVNYIQFFVFKSNGNITYPSGGMKPGETSLSGTIRVWTDMTVEATTTSYTNVFMEKDKKLGTYTLPTCDKKKAYGGNFDLEYQP